MTQVESKSGDDATVGFFLIDEFNYEVLVQMEKNQRFAFVFESEELKDSFLSSTRKNGGSVSPLARGNNDVVHSWDNETFKLSYNGIEIKISQTPRDISLQPGDRILIYRSPSRRKSLEKH
jgi:hypothetical protein